MKSEISGDVPWVGQSIKRKEDHRLLIGEGSYVADITMPRMLHVGFLRSPHAHARILRIDATAALALPGVMGVVTGQDTAYLGSILSDLSVPNLPGETKRPIFGPLPLDEVKYVGDLVAAVIVQERQALEDAIDLIEVAYELLPSVIDAEAALRPGAPLLYPEWGDNVVYHQRLEKGDVDGAFASADLVVRERFRGHRCGATPMEPRSCLASFNAAEGLVLWLTTQRSHIKRHLLAEFFKMPDNKIRVIAPKDVGGGFGVKAPLYREEILVCHLAMRFGRPIKWIENRQENLQNIGQERDQIHELEIALTREGKILALRDRMVANCGDARVPIYVSFAMPWLGMMYLPNGYTIPCVDIDLTCVVTNKAGLTPSRSFGSFSGRFAIDRIVDIAARRLGIDPLEIRARNCIREFPYVTATGVNVDSGDFLGALAKIRDALSYEAFRAEQALARKQGRYLGIGFSLGIEFSGLSSRILVPMERQPGYGVATIRVDANGQVQVAHGDQPQGQGHDTTISQVVADELGITPDDVNVISGDTQSVPFAAGTLASRMGGYTTSAVLLAARGLKPKLVRIAAYLLGIEASGPENFVFSRGEIVWRNDPAKHISLAHVAETALLAPTELPPGMDGGLNYTAHFEADTNGMHSCNVHGVIVEVFPQSGQFDILRYVAVDDAGRAINPMVVQGQLHGGIALGISNACFEEYVYSESGDQLATSLQDYLIASARDLPHIETVEHNVPTPHNPLGAKGKGEGPTGMVPGALGNALEDALVPLHVSITEMPFTPERLWRLVEAVRD